MNKIVKRILIGLGVFIAVLVAAVVVLFIVIDPNDYRDEISEMAYKATGRKIELKGDIGLKIFPRLSFSIKDVSMAQGEGFGDAPLLHVEDMALSMNLFPLLRGELQVDAVSLDGLDLNLAVDSKGRNNWEVEAADAASVPSAEISDKSAEQASTSAEPAGTPATGDAEEAEKRMKSLLASRISSVKINNCSLKYDDKQTKESMQVQLNKLELSNVGLNRNMNYILDVAAELGQDLKGAFAMEGTARYDLGKEFLELDIKSFAVNGEAPAYFSAKQEITGSMSGHIDGKNNSSELKVALKSVFLNGDAVIKLNKESGQGNLELNAKPVVLIKSLSPAMQKDLALPPELLADNGPIRSMDVKLAFNATSKIINVNTAELRLGGSEMVLSAPSLKAVLGDSGQLASLEGDIALKGSLRPYLPLAGLTPGGKGNELNKLDTALHFKMAGDDVSITQFRLLLDDKLLELASKRMDLRLAPAGPQLPIHSFKADLSASAKPRALMDGLGMAMETADPKVLENFNSSFNVALDNNSLKLQNFKGKLDETDISVLVELLLSGAKGLPKGASSYLKADLQLGTINLDRYMPPESAATASPAEQQTAGSAPATSSEPIKAPLKGTPFEKAKADISAGIKHLTIEKAPISNIVLKASLNDGVFNISQASLNAFSAKFNLSSRLNLVNAQGQNNLKTSLNGLDIGEALRVMLDEKRLTGITSANLDLTFKGLDADTILASLGGNGSVLVKDGVLRDFQLIPQDSPAELLKYRQNDYHFSDLSGSFTAVNGTLTNNDLNYKDKNISLTGKGTVVLPKQHLDYRAVIKTKATGEVPLLIHGPLSDLSIGLDAEALARMAVEKGKEALVKDLQKKGKLPQGDTSEERREAVKQEVNKKIGKEIERGLGKLLKK